MSSGGGNTVWDDTWNSTMNIMTLGLHDKVKDDLSTGKLTGKWEMEKQMQEAEDAAKRQREYELAEIEKQKKNEQGLEKATQERNARIRSQSQRRSSIATDGLGGGSSSGGGGGKNLLGL